jgi:hypothetical protein
LGYPGRRFDTRGGYEMTAGFGERYSASHGQSEPMGIEWYGESSGNRDNR